jgi:hypothetical protein
MTFWIDDDDLASKRMFVFLKMFMSLAESGTVLQAPLLKGLSTATART